MRRGDIVYPLERYRWCQNSCGPNIWHDVEPYEKFEIIGIGCGVDLRNIEKGYRVYFSSEDRFDNIFNIKRVRREKLNRLRLICEHKN
jgi:hypothetical protein